MAKDLVNSLMVVDSTYVIHSHNELKNLFLFYDELIIPKFDNVFENPKLAFNKLNVNAAYLFKLYEGIPTSEIADLQNKLDKIKIPVEDVEH